MQRFLVAFLVTVFVSGAGTKVTADDKDVTAILDKAMKALGGEEKLKKIKAVTWKTKGKIRFKADDRIPPGAEEHEFTGRTTAEGLVRFRSERESISSARNSIASGRTRPRA